MGRVSSLIVTVVCVGSLVAACGSGSTSAGPLVPSEGVARESVAGDAPLDDLVAGFNAAGFDLFATTPAGDNTVLSPLSIDHALLMARGAADEATGAAIDSALGLPAGRSAHEAWNALDEWLAASAGTAENIDGGPTPVLTVAGRVWPDVAASPDQEWLDLLAATHGAEVETIDNDRPDEATARINEWVGEETEGLITDLVPPGFIDGSTVLVLTDAVYFEAQWASVFGKYGTDVVSFTRLEGSTVGVEVMVDLEQPGPRGVGEGWEAFVLPYRSGLDAVGFEMLVVVPEVGRFEEIRGRLGADFVAEVDGTLSTGPWELRVPEWTTSTQLDLLPWLTDIGAAPGAYPGIAAGAFLAGGVHGADIAVDEIGTVAAAATALGFDDSGGDDPEISITVDRPFLYLVRHTSGAVLFIGQVTDPTA